MQLLQSAAHDFPELDASDREDRVTSNIGLPASLDFGGFTFPAVWASDNPSVINPETGEVVRPPFREGNATVTLTVTFTHPDYPGLTVSRDYTFIVQANAPLTATFAGTNRAQLDALLAENDVILQTPGNFGLSAGNTLVVPAGSTLTVATILNIRRGAELVVEGTLIIADGARINNDGGSTPGGGRITINAGGTMINNGHVENVSNSVVTNNGTIVNNARFEIRAQTTFANLGAVTANTPLNIHRDAVVITATKAA